MALSPPPLPAKPVKTSRVSLTKSQAASDTGRILVDFLMTVADDGQISVDEVLTLHAWVQRPDVTKFAGGGLSPRSRVVFGLAGTAGLVTMTEDFIIFGKRDGWADPIFWRWCDGSPTAC